MYSSRESALFITERRKWSKKKKQQKKQGNANRGEFLKSDISRVADIAACDFQSETGVILSIQGV